MTDMARSVWTPAQVREIDRVAIGNCGIPGYELMTRAGQAAFSIACQRWPEARRWLVLCGAGNNAGDGYVVARLAQAAGLDVTVAAVSDPAGLRGDAATAWCDYTNAGGMTQPFSVALIDSSELVVDALLGTGLQRPVAGEYLAAIEAVNAEARPVLALDVPSGLDSLSGAILGAAMWADLTVTFVGLKAGLYLGSGPEYCGEIEFAGLDIPVSAVQQLETAPLFNLYSRDDLLHLLPPRPANAHKGSFGHLLIVGGNRGMSGAVRLAGEAALRAGAGLVTVATRPEHALWLPLTRPELMCSGVGSARDLAPLLERATDFAVSALCAEAVGAMEALNAATFEYLKTRQQFGRPIGSNQALQHRAVDMMIHCEQSRSMAYLAAVKVQSQDANERKRTVSAAKIQIGRSGRCISQEAIQLHGGMGVSNELAAGHYAKRLVMINATLGDVDHHSERFASAA